MLICQSTLNTKVIQFDEYVIQKKKRIVQPYTVHTHNMDKEGQCSFPDRLSSNTHPVNNTSLANGDIK
jgi:hypothetical protein